MNSRIRPVLLSLAAILLTLAGVGRIVATYHVFNQTDDEPIHIAAGLQWLDQGRYDYDLQHPVVSRIATAIVPYLAGMHSTGRTAPLEEGNAILYSGGNYFHNLALARSGILPFFLLASAVVWFWTRRLFGDGAALAAVFLFTTLPPILAHSGLATTDMAGGACLAASLYAFLLWLERPVWQRTVLFGLSLALALSTKLSAVMFAPLCMAVILALYAIAERPCAKEWSHRVSGLVLAVVMAFVLVWAGYRFSFGPLPGQAYLAANPPVTFARFLGNTRLPAPEFFNGLALVQLHNYLGQDAWFFGQFRTHGWWYFFPLMLAVKTPIAFLVLAISGYVIIWRNAKSRFAWQPLVPGACAVVILLSVVPAHLDIGLRHILGIYPLLAVTAGVGALRLLQSGNRIVLAIAVALLLWQGADSLRAHPDYLAYTNEFIRHAPERYISDSDLDWGQDLQRLSDKLKQLGVNEVSLGYFGTADVSQHGLPTLHPVAAYQPTTGWIAVSAFVETVESAELQQQAGRSDDPLGWLHAEQPVARIGKSIKLYYIPSTERTSQ